MSREIRSVFLLLGLAVAGHGVRLLLLPRGAPPGELLARLAAPGTDPARQRAQAAREARPLGAEERVDVNTAPAEELARLPRVGMSLAKRIVADRAARGRFHGLRDLDRVPGVGPALLASMAPRVSFGGVSTSDPLPGQGDATPRSAGVPDRPAGSPGAGLVDLNSAGEKDLLALPGIGPARARAILAYRRDNGPFAAVSHLGRVPGFSHSLVARLTPLVEVR